jgi:hypothetical protein
MPVGGKVIPLHGSTIPSLVFMGSCAAAVAVWVIQVPVEGIVEGYLNHVLSLKRGEEPREQPTRMFGVGNFTMGSRLSCASGRKRKEAR